MQQIDLTMTASAIQVSAGGERAGQMILQNRGVNPIYVGRSSAVTSATGFKLDPTGSINWIVPTLLGSWYVLGTASDVVVVIWD